MTKPTSTFAKDLLFVATLSIAGCATGPNQTANSQPLLPTVRSADANDNGGASDLLYISNYETSAVKAYAWPSLIQKQKLKGFTHQIGLCTDAKGDVYVANTNANNIDEYAHGGTKPIATLADLPKFYPSSCAVDPVSGDLAVTNLGYGSYGSKTANVVIFKNARGEPKPYVIGTIYYYYQCGYDNKGDLIVDGSQNSIVAFAILRHGKSDLESLTLNQAFKAPGGIQWDGKHWAIGDQRATIYRFDVNGTEGTKVGTTTLNLNDAVYQFFIWHDRVIAPEYSTGQAQIFKYPAGGTAISSIPNLHLPEAAIVSRGI